MQNPSVVEKAFLQALEKRSTADRAVFLDAACQGDPELRREVERLLEAHSRVGSFLEPGDLPTTPPLPVADKSGTVIAGRYKLLELIGEGGMGSVWMAQQSEPVKRMVALKLIKAGMDSRAVLSRFEVERQAQGMMDHPNIARVLDGGIAPDGRPFFVMELVKGIQITRFCDTRRLTPRERLELFVPVCQAIQHAHQKGIIHRDIKPSNVLIALYDDRPVPKVIDFGIAKAIGQTLTDKTLFTGFGAVVGTLEYMSPEQASLNNLDIDTRSDVYSLGALLYELLAGTPPFRPEELQKAGLLEMLRLVRDSEPPRPSMRLSTAHELPRISADRGTEPKTLTGLLRNELDWIVMKALEKDRARRYETVSGFAADVQRYLAGEAVQAHPPSTGYRVRKFARKHRTLLMTAAAFAVLLSAASAISGYLAIKAARAEQVAEEKRHEAEDNAKEAATQASLYRQAAQSHLQARIDAEIAARSLQIDVDTAEMGKDPIVGLLRLAKPYPQNLHGITFGRTAKDDAKSGIQHFAWDDPQGRAMLLRQFVTATILVGTQNHAPLLPPLTHDGQPIESVQLSPDRQTVLTTGQDCTARLWDVRAKRTIAILRQGDEKVLASDYSPDGRTVFTADQSGRVRLWDVPSGTVRTMTADRPDRFEVAADLPMKELRALHRSHKETTQITPTRLLTRGWSAHYSDRIASIRWRGPVDLWDSVTGRHIARLDKPITDSASFQLGVTGVPLSGWQMDHTASA